MMWWRLTGLFSLVTALAASNNTTEIYLESLVERVETLEFKLNMLEGNEKQPVFDPQHVMVYTTLSESMRGVSNHVTIIFDKPKVNIGDNYNENDGIYVAAYSGKILVFWTIGTDKVAKTELMVEDVVVGVLTSGAGALTVTTNNQYNRGSTSTTNRESTSSTVVVCDIRKGEHLFVRTATSENNILKDVSSLLIIHL